ITHNTKRKTSMSVGLSTHQHQVKEHVFTLNVAGRKVPGVFWTAAGERTGAPVVLVSHGGSGHKRAQSIMDVVHELTARCGFVVVAIDGPVHGDRRASFAEGPEVRDEFRSLW